MIEQSEVEKGLRYMREHAHDLASAKANRIYITHYLKVCFSDCYKDSRSKTVEDRKNDAYGHPAYVQQLEALQIAIQEEETHRWKMEAAKALTEVWRTQEANNRNTDRSHQ